MMDAIQLDNLTPQQRRDLLAQLLAAEQQQQSHPVSCTQERLWFLDRFEPGSAAYNMVTAVRFTGPIHVDALQQSINALVMRHEALRTVFAEENDRPVQIVRDGCQVDVIAIDMRAQHGDACEEQAMALIEREARVPFDLRSGPLLRVHLIRLAEREQILLICMHHIIGDGWSNGIFCNELCQLYNDAKAGRTTKLAPLSIQFVDYALWERERLERGEFNEQIEQWKKLLAGAPPVLELPTDRPRPAKESHRGERLYFQVPPALVEGLRKFAHSEGSTLYMALISLFDLLLHRYSGQSDLVIGTPVANRNRSEVEGILGFFSNTLPLRVQMDARQNFRALIRTVRDAALSLYSNAEVPFERLVQELKPARNLSHSPIFQVMLSYDSTGARTWSFDEIIARNTHIDTATAKFDVMMHLDDQPQGLRGYLEYNTDLFDNRTANQMVEHFMNLAHAVLDDADLPVARLPMLSPQQRGQILVHFNNTHTVYGDESTQPLHALFEAQAARTPGHIAVHYGGHHLTYAQLDERATSLAVALEHAGVKPDALVGVFMDRSIELVIALLATLKAGGAYVPIDPGYPANRIAFMLHDSGTKVLLTQPHLMDRIPANQGTLIALDANGDAVNTNHSPSSMTSPCVHSDHLSYVIYTSGSTGKPKGVAIPHRAIVNHMLWMRAEFSLAAADRVLQKTPTSFDASVWEFYAPLISGAQLVMAAPDSHRSPAQLIKTVIDQQITTLQLVPTMLEAMLDDPMITQCTSLNRIFCGGEALTTHLAGRLRNALPSVEMINLYGPTEAAIDATFWRCGTEDASHQTLPIGRPIANMRACILDSHHQPQPIGVPGELHLTGLGLAREYLNQPQLTKDKFIANPLSDLPGERLYKTGDLARYRADGVIEYLGRVDHQVKLRGHRIELGEIESVLAKLPGIAACAVVVRLDDPANTLLAAYLIKTAGSTIDENAIRQSMRDELPDYMVPAAIVWLDELPRLPSGKVNRNALPAPKRSSSTEAHTDEPRNPIEASLVKIWCEVLKLDRVGIHENFFDLGGHSLMAAQITSRIRTAHHIELPLRAMFESPTVAGLALAMERMPAASGPAAGPIKRINRGTRIATPPASMVDSQRKDV